MIIVYILEAVFTGIACLLVFPYYKTLLDTLTDIALTMYPAMNIQNQTFLKILPIFTLGLIIFFCINYVRSKISNKGGTE